MQSESSEPRVLSSGAPTGERRVAIRPGVAIVAVVLVAIAVAALVGGLTTTPMPQSTHVRGGDEGSDRAPSGSEHTRRGAVRAAVSYAGAFGADEVVNPTRFGELVDAIATPRLAARLRSEEEAAQNSAGTRQLQAAARSGGIFAQSMPLAYRLRSYRRRRAVVELWELSVLSGGPVAPFARFQRSRSTLKWSDGEWKLARLGRPRVGPTPAIERHAATNSSRAFVRTLRPYRELRGAP